MGGCGKFRGFLLTKGKGATCCPKVNWVSGGGGGGGGGGGDGGGGRGGDMVPASPLPSRSRSGGGVMSFGISSSISAEILSLHLLVVFSRSFSLHLIVVVI